MATFEGPEDNPRDDQPIDQQEYEKWEASQNAGSPQVKVEWLAGFHAGAASRDAEVAELRAPGPCGKHPKACWVERRVPFAIASWLQWIAELTVDELYELEANHPPLIGHTGRPHGKEEECPSSCPCRRAKAHCSVCADISDLRSKIEAARLDVCDDVLSVLSASANLGKDAASIRDWLQRYRDDIETATKNETNKR